MFLFWKCVRFCFCCCLFLFDVCICILCLLPCLTRCSFIDVLSCGVHERTSIKERLGSFQPSPSIHLHHWGFWKIKKTTWLVRTIRDVHLFFHTATELWWWRLFFSVAWRPQRPYGQFGTEKPRTSTSTFTQLVSCVVALGLFGAQVCYKLSPLR